MNILIQRFAMAVLLRKHRAISPFYLAAFVYHMIVNTLFEAPNSLFFKLSLLKCWRFDEHLHIFLLIAQMVIRDRWAAPGAQVVTAVHLNFSAQC